MVSRRKLIAGGAGLAVTAAIGSGALWAWPQLVPPPAPLGFALSETEIADAMAFLREHPAIDTHAHPGRTFIKGADDLTWLLWLYQKFGTFEPRVIEDMKAGGMAAVSFSAVSDFPVLNPVKGGLASVREFKSGEAWNYYKAQMANLQAVLASGAVFPVLEPGDVDAAVKAVKPGAFLAVEGGDFVEDDASRIAEAERDGVRMITLVHYVTGSKLGDIMTMPPVHGGITTLGREVIRAMNGAGVMADLSHATEKTAFGALEESSKPVVATHTHVNSLGIGHPRFISPELAKAIAASGGYVGAWPAGIGIETLNGFVDRIAQLSDMLGTDYVALGTDMDANYKPVWETYRKMPLVVGAMLKRGFSREDTAKIIGGNFLRVFERTRAATA